MRSQTSLVAKQCRLQTWAAQISDCQNRPEGMSVDAWCLQHGITKANYYYRFKCVRQACLDSVVADTEPSFVEVPVTALNESANVPVPSGSVAASVRTASGINIEIYESASDEFLQKLLGALCYA